MDNEMDWFGRRNKLRTIHDLDIIISKRRFCFEETMQNIVEKFLTLYLSDVSYMIALKPKQTRKMKQMLR